jgi:virginiamycin B lyase
MNRKLVILGMMMLMAAAVFAAVKVEIREWDVPWEDTRPRDPYLDGKGRVWFVGQTGDYIAALDPSSGKFERYELEQGAGPHNLIVDDAGQIWFAGNRKGYIGRLDPATRKIAKYPMSNAAAGDPHTLIFDRSGDIWFTVQAGGYVGKLDRDSGKVQLIKVETRGARPYGIVIDAKGRPWFNQFGTNRIGMIDPATMKLREYILPEGSRGRRIAAAADGGIWYADYARGFLSRLDPETGKVREWQTPGGKGSLPYAMAMDHRGRFWFVETGPQPNRLIGFDPKSEEFFAEEVIPSGGSTVRHMIFHAPSREIWFGTDKNTVARARIPG